MIPNSLGMHIPWYKKSQCFKHITSNQLSSLIILQHTLISFKQFVKIFFGDLRCWRVWFDQTQSWHHFLPLPMVLCFASSAINFHHNYCCELIKSSKYALSPNETSLMLPFKSVLSLGYSNSYLDLISSSFNPKLDFSS